MQPGIHSLLAQFNPQSVATPHGSDKNATGMYVGKAIIPTNGLQLPTGQIKMQREEEVKNERYNHRVSCNSPRVR